MPSKKRSSKQFVLRIVLLVVGVLLISGGSYALLKKQPGTTSNVTHLDSDVLSPPAHVFPYQSAFDGHGVDTVTEQAPRIVALMIDNSPDVVHQAGLAEARVVYEAPVEGGVTRYMALFDESATTSLVGPVRSARDYFLDWVEEYGNPLYMHVGGSPEALTRLKNVDFFDANEFRWGSYFFRSPDHPAPHNVFTTSEKWQALATTTYGQSIVQKDWQGWKFGDVSVITSTSSTLQITIPYTANYKVSWKLNGASNTYERFINQIADTDYKNQTIQADNVVVQFVSMRTIDEVGRRDVTTIGSGDVVMVQKGLLTRGTWRKESKAGRTKFFDTAGNEITLIPGITWVQVVPKDINVMITN